MAYEIDIIGVGKESKSGDAIAIRWDNLLGERDEQRVVIIDGGFRDSGNDVVAHVKKYYKTDIIDAVISTHPDQDHVNGLHVVLEELSVKQLWIHKPWEHNEGLAEAFIDGRVTDESIARRLRESLDAASELVAKAENDGVTIIEPFRGLSLYDEGEFYVLGPTEEFYESLIPDFDGMPPSGQSPKTHSLLAEFASTVARKVRKFFSTWGEDELDDDDTTSAKNNSSVISQLVVDGRRSLFTSDAGVTALSHVADHLELSEQVDLHFVQIPHHGSRRNVGPTVLNRLIGKAVQEGETRNISAIASTAKKGEPKHPRKAVMNAFTHRGVKALATRGETIRHGHNAPDREGWNAATPDKYYWKYEDEE